MHLCMYVKQDQFSDPNYRERYDIDNIKGLLLSDWLVINVCLFVFPNSSQFFIRIRSYVSNMKLKDDEGIMFFIIFIYAGMFYVMSI